MAKSFIPARIAPLTAVLLAAGVAGCATSGPTPVEVTRFSRPELAATPRGAVGVLPGPGVDGASILFSQYAAAVSGELARLGYRAAGDAGVLAEVSVERGVAEPPPRSPVSVGLGGATGGYGSGVGVGLGFNLAGRPKPMVATMLAVTLRDRVSGRSLWEGRARSAAPQGSPLADTPAGARRLAAALFQGFPGRSGETIVVR